jgi:hypothetical protein
MVRECADWDAQCFPLTGGDVIAIMVRFGLVPLEDAKVAYIGCVQRHRRRQNSILKDRQMPNNVGDKGHHNASSAVQPSTTDQLVDAIYQTSDGVAADLAAERTADEIATVRTQAVNAYTSTEALRSALDLCDGLIDCQIREGVVNSIDELKAIQARIRAALSGSPAPSTDWRSMDTARKNGRPVLGLFKKTFDSPYNNEAPSRWGGTQIVMRHPGLADDGYDCGWNLANGGCGGFPDEWFEGWMPLPPAPDAARTALAGSAGGRIKVTARGVSIRVHTWALAELASEMAGPGAEIRYVPEGSDDGWCVWTEGETWPDEDDFRYHLFALEVKRLRRERHSLAPSAGVTAPQTATEGK